MGDGAVDELEAFLVFLKAGSFSTERGKERGGKKIMAVTKKAYWPLSSPHDSDIASKREWESSSSDYPMLQILWKTRGGVKS